MKHKIVNSTILFTIVALFLLSGCSNLFNMLFEPVQKINPGSASLSVAIHDAGTVFSKSRVIAPLSSDMTYDVSLFKGANDKNPVVKKDITISDDVVFDALDDNTDYIVTVKGMNTKGTVVVSGDSSFTAKTGANTVLVELSMVRGTGTGDLYLRYSFSEYAYADLVLALTTFSGDLAADFTGEGEAYFSEENGLFILDKKGIPAGTYILSMSYYTQEGVRYVPIDPLVEIYTGCTSSTKDPIPVDISSGSAARILYAASSAESENTGTTFTDPVTLDKAIQIINEDSSLIGESYAMILLTQHISLKNTVINPAIEKNIVILPGTDDETLNITFNGIRESVFTVGTESVTGGLILSGITIGSESETFYAAQGLIKIDNGTLYLDESVVLQSNKIPLCTSEEPYILSKGGAVNLSPQGSLEAYGGLIQGCSAGMGGAIYAEGGEVPENFESLNLIDLTINSCNSALGGAIYSFGRDVVANNLKISVCTAAEVINAEDGGYGGALYVEYGSFTLMGGSITGCTASPALNSEKVTKGGAVYIGPDGILYIVSGFPLVFAENDAEYGSNIFIENYSLSSIQFDGISPSDYADFKTKIVYSTSQGIEQGYYNEHLFNGTGVLGDEYEIFDWRDLRGIRYIEETGKLFKQTASIDLAEGTGEFMPIPEFSGTYDGNGYKISNLSITGLDDACENIGLFSYVDGGTLRNIFLENADIYVGLVPATSHGTLAGQILNSTIENCGVTGMITLYEETPVDENCGGLVGFAGNSAISGSFCAANISAPAIYNVGGLVGYVGDTEEGTTINNCYTSMQTVEGNLYCGAIIGYVTSGLFQAAVTNTYSIAVPSGTNRNFIGYMTTSPEPDLSNTYSIDFEPSSGLSAESQKQIAEITALTSAALGTDGWIYPENGLIFPYLSWHETMYKPFTFIVQSIEFQNGGETTGTLDSNDRIVITFSLPVDPSSIRTEFTSDPLEAGALTIIGSSSTTDTLAFAGTLADEFNLGIFELIGFGIVSSTGSADCASISLSGDGTVLTIEIGAISALSFYSLELNEFIRFNPSANIRSINNQPIIDTIYASIGDSVSFF